VPTSQNATALALTIYDWTCPDFRRPNFVLTARGNHSTFGDLITYEDPSSFPYVARIFGLDGQTRSDVLTELAANYSLVVGQCQSEVNVLEYALASLPSQQYTDPSAPAVLYRGDGRDVEYFCNQFIQKWGLSIDDCIAKVFAPQSTISVRPFWSTTSDVALTSNYQAAVLYNIMPNPSLRSGWHARSVVDFSVEPSEEEYLYPSDSRFIVQSTQCLTNPSTGRPFWNITLLEINPTMPASTSSFNPSAAVVQCVS
jgi:hypothetical protein